MEHYNYFLCLVGLPVSVLYAYGMYWWVLVYVDLNFILNQCVFVFLNTGPSQNDKFDQSVFNIFKWVGGQI